MDNHFFKPHELAARVRKERTGYYLLNIKKLNLSTKFFLRKQFRNSPVLSQRSLSHPNSIRFKKMIIHSALIKNLEEKLPEGSFT